MAQDSSDDVAIELEPTYASSSSDVLNPDPAAAAAAAGAGAGADVAGDGDINDIGLERTQLATVRAHQVRALALKTLAYERHTFCTTCCCVFMCPFLMVLLCGVLSFVVTALLSNIITAKDVQYCSNVTAVDLNTNIPLVNPPTDSNGRLLLNFDQSSSILNTCVNWFSHDYPYSMPYSPASIYNGSCSNSMYNQAICPLIDTTLLPSPSNTWLPNFANPNDVMIFAQVLAFEVSNQQNYWGWFQNSPNVNLGSRAQAPSVPLVSLTSQPVIQNMTGFLANLTTEYLINPNTIDLDSIANDPAALLDVQVEARPYFHLMPGTPTDMDDAWTALIVQILAQLDALTKPPKSALQNSTAVQNYTIEVANILQALPFGAITMDEMSPGQDALFSYLLQIGTNRRLAYTSTVDSSATQTGGANAIPPAPFPTEGLRRILFHSQIAQVLIRIASSLPNVTLSQGLRIFPTNANTGINASVGSQVGQILYPFGVSFLFPIFLLNLVKDKEERILVMMKMNGLKLPVYWISEYIHFYILHIISTAVFIITGWIFRLQFFTLTAPGVYVLLFFLWGHVQILMAFLLSSFFQRSRYALLVGFLLVVIGVIINIATEALYASEPAPLAYFIWPPFAFYRAIGIINLAAFTLGTPSYTMSIVVSGNEVYSAIVAMIIAIIILSFASVYLFEVLPSEFGVRKPWHYPVTYPYKYLRRVIFGKVDKQPIVTAHSDIKTHEEDDDVVAERERVFARKYPANCSLVLRNMKKYYGRKQAVKGVSLAVERGLVFGLLGPNGAGKTTLISILTGLYEASYGEAYLAGYRVGEEMDMVYRSMGVCPQHDILWPELTVDEHLFFYARLKGVAIKDEKAAVDDALSRVSLTNFRSRPSHGLSGGEKRRLSIAIALIGNGQVIFLDEPTTGLDPEVRRLIWNIINEQRVGKTIILTTHSMEEAEVLCQRIGIMAKGTMRCLGPQLLLKNKYGSGFRVVIMCNPVDAPRATGYIESLLPSDFKRIDSFAGNFSYEFPSRDNSVSRVFEALSQHAQDHGIQDWGLSQTSLEEVFLRIISEADAMADS